MRTPLDPARGGVHLTVASPSEPPADPSPARVPYVPWLVAALAWGAATALLGWVAVGALASVAWLTAVRTPAADVMATIGQGWLAVHGAPVSLGGASLRLVPLGLALLVAAGCALAAQHAATQHPAEADAGLRAGWTAWAGVVGCTVGAYLVVGLVLAGVVGSPTQVGAALPGLALVPLVGAGAGAAVGLRPDLLKGAPDWVRRLPAATGVGSAVLAAGSLAALVVALVAHWSRVGSLHEVLAPDPVGAVLLTLVQAAYLPNLLLWAGSFVLGSGVVLGAGGLVAPGVASPAVLPAVPVLGAVPTVASPGDWAWLVVGVAAGAASAWWYLRGTPAHWLNGLWQGFLAGVAPGLAWVVASLASGGDLGTQRLAGFGPRFPELLLWGTVPLAVAGALWGLGRALWLSRTATAGEEPTG